MTAASVLRAAPNVSVRPAGAYPPDLAALIGRAEIKRAVAAVSRWPGYQPTPLRGLPELARRLGVGDFHLKDESERFGLGSFKALGGAYAVQRLMLARRGANTAPPTVCCATDGNHGKAVAWAARLVGSRCVVFLHERVSTAREEAIRGFGAEIVRTAGNYDASVAAAAAAAAANDWAVVSDTAYEGYTSIPLDIMAGYAVLGAEVLAQLRAPPTHVFLQAGVGGMAAALAAWFWAELQAERPRIIVVESDAAACLFETARAGRPVPVRGDLDTIMAGLACGEVSAVAWPILQAAAFAFLTISDPAATSMMRSLAHGEYGLRLVIGESGVAGLSAAVAAAGDPDLRAMLQIDADSRLLCIGTEGDTDPALFRQITGLTAEAVRAAAT